MHDVGFHVVLGEESVDFVRICTGFHHHTEFLSVHVIEYLLKSGFIGPHIHGRYRFSVVGYDTGSCVILMYVETNVPHAISAPLVLAN